MRRITPIATLSALIVSAGCGGGDGAADGDRLPRWTLGLETRIGSLDDPELGLTRVSFVAFGPDSLVYIAQSAEHEIRAYGRDGTLRRRIGREGEGPGEFRSISAIGFLHDTLFASDAGLRRVSTFDAEGNPIESVPWSSTAGEVTPPVFYLPSVPEVILADGSALALQGYGYILPVPVERFSVPWLRIFRDSTAQDTIATREVEVPPRETLTENGRDFQFVPPIGDQDLWALMDDGSGIVKIERRVATSAEQHTFRLVKLDPAGDTVLTRVYDYAPVATPPGEVDRQVENRLALYRAGSPTPSREGLTRIYAQPGFIPSYLPAASSIEPVQDGTIWLERERADADSTKWTAIGWDGDVEGEIRLPAGARIMAGHGDVLAVLELDELDVPYVLVYRIIRQD